MKTSDATSKVTAGVHFQSSHLGQVLAVFDDPQFVAFHRRAVAIPFGGDPAREPGNPADGVQRQVCNGQGRWRTVMSNGVVVDPCSS